MKLALFAPPRDLTSWEQVLDYCVEQELPGLELYPSFDLEQPDPTVAVRIGESARRRGISLICQSLCADPAAEDGEVWVERLKQWVDCCVAAGVPYLHHTLAFRIEPNAYGVTTYRELLRRVVPRLQSVIDYAGERGIQCLYEEQGYWFNGAERLGELLTELDRPVGVCLDFGNSMFVDEPPEIFAGPLLPWVKHVHLKDYLLRPGTMPDPGPGWHTTLRGDRLLDVTMGHGSVDFVRLMTMLRQVGYEGWYSLEYCGDHSREAIDRSLENVRRYLRQTACSAQA